jgi:signal transduction histidine kinase
MLKKFSEQINVFKICRKQGLPLRNCPQFLFMIMGLINIIILITSFLIGTQYISDPTVVALIDTILALILIIITFIITKSVQNLAEASRLKSEFINIVCHQLRSPTTNIKWITEFLTLEKVDEKKKEEYMDHLKENIARMVELIDKLIIISRIEEGAFPIKKKEASLLKITEGLISQAKAFADASNVEIIFHPEEPKEKTFFDPDLIKLVVENLIDNAIRYTKKGGKIEIWVKQKGKDLYFKISDNGLGIPKEDQQFIFQKFFRSQNVTKQQMTRGSGLGLYIAKLIIDRSKGKIWFESEENKGTTFYFTIPVK